MDSNRSIFIFAQEEDDSIIIVKLRLMISLALAPALVLSGLDLLRDLITYSRTGTIWFGLIFSVVFFVASLSGLLVLTSARFSGYLLRQLLERNRFRPPRWIVLVFSVIGLVALGLGWIMLLTGSLPVMWISYGLVLVWWVYIGTLSTTWIFNKGGAISLAATVSVIWMLVLYSGFLFTAASGTFEQVINRETTQMVDIWTDDVLSAYPKQPTQTQESQELWADDTELVVPASDGPTVDNINVSDDEDRDYLQSVLNLIFPDGMEGMSDEELSIEIMQYITSSFRLESNSGTATKIIQDGYAICGGMSISFRALVQQAGLPARYIGLFGLPYFGSHVLAEVYYDGDWHLFDPTFGTFFYSSDEYDRNGEIASLAELLASSTDNWSLIKVVDQPWQGIYSTDIQAILADSDYLSDYYGFDFVNVYRSYFKNGFPISYGREKTLSFPLYLDYTNSENDSVKLSLGEVNKNQEDFIQLTAALDTAGKVGSYYIGGSNPEMVDLVEITSDSPGFVRLTYHGVDESKPLLGLLPLQSAVILEANQEGTIAEFLIRTTSPKANVQLYSRTGDIFWIDAIEAEWLGEELPSN